MSTREGAIALTMGAFLGMAASGCGGVALEVGSNDGGTASDGGGTLSPGVTAADAAVSDGPRCTDACAAGATLCLGASAYATCAQDRPGCVYETPPSLCPGATPYCDQGACTSTPPLSPPSCRASGAGLTNCGAASESCCTSPVVSGGTYDRTYGPGTLADPAVSDFRLDRYDVTVARFRPFVAAWNGGYTPPAGSGKHTHLNGGLGLNDASSPGSFEPGWVTTDDDRIAPTDANLACGTYATWTSTAGIRETLPINCVTWAEAHAFCIWDGGFLPSAAEWEYAAAGGSQGRDYPWGSTAPGTTNQYAIYACYFPTGAAICTDASNIAPVGTATLGAGLWGHLDLAGNVWQWMLDWASYDYDLGPCTDCAYLTAPAPAQPSGHPPTIPGPPPVPPFREARGGDFYYGAEYLHPVVRGSVGGITERDNRFGFRCARAP